MSATDPFPKERFAATLRRVPRYARLAWRLAREPLLSRLRRVGVVAAAGYLASPIDAVPGVIPVIGQLDDLAVALAAIRFALAGLSPQQRAAHLSAVGLQDADLGEDLRTVGMTTAWLIRAGGRTTARAISTGARVAADGGRRLRTGVSRLQTGAAHLKAGGQEVATGRDRLRRVVTERLRPASTPPDDPPHPEEPR